MGRNNKHAYGLLREEIEDARAFNAHKADIESEARRKALRTREKHVSSVYYILHSKKQKFELEINLEYRPSVKLKILEGSPDWEALFSEIAQEENYKFLSPTQLILRIIRKLVNPAYHSLEKAYEFLARKPYISYFKTGYKHALEPKYKEVYSQIMAEDPGIDAILSHPALKRRENTNVMEEAEQAAYIYLFKKNIVIFLHLNKSNQP